MAGIDNVITDNVIANSKINGSGVNSSAMTDSAMTNPDPYSLDHYVGNTPLVRLQRLASHTKATVYGKLEGNNPAGSVKDRPAYNMILQAERRGDIKPGDT